MILTKEQLGYIAGIIDGEGCISITRSKKYYNCSYSYTVVFTVSNTNILLMEYLVNTTKCGKIRTNKEIKGNWKKSFTWALINSEVKFLLPQIKHLLILKRQQAELILEYFQCKDKIDKELIFDEIKELNKKGI